MLACYLLPRQRPMSSTILSNRYPISIKCLTSREILLRLHCGSVNEMLMFCNIHTAGRIGGQTDVRTGGPVVGIHQSINRDVTI